jgi:UDP-2-acetamido-3-amino-2,3-dideoxy-glucuronate N-acetyltransferase
MVRLQRPPFRIRTRKSCDHIAVAVSTFIDPNARFEGDRLGPGSRVLAYVRVAPGVAIGRNCVLHDHAVLIGAVTLEDDVAVHTGAQLLGRIRVEQGVTVGAGAVVGGKSRSGEDAGLLEIIVHRFASIGPNVTVLPGVAIGRRAIVEPGSVVRQDVPANAVVSGNPATIVSYVDSGQEVAAQEVLLPSSVGAAVTETRVRGVTIHRLAYASDLRGSLTATEFSSLPFAPRRLFTVYDVPSESVRGSHAHRTCAQFLVCTLGALSCLVDDGSARAEIRLASPDVGLHIPPMIWGTQWKYTRDAVLLVLASHPYDAADYIRDYEEFLQVLEPDRPASPSD